MSISLCLKAHIIRKLYSLQMSFVIFVLRHNRWHI